MIEEMLMDIAERGYSPEDIKGAVIKVLQPFFDNIESLNQYACESQLLSAFGFFIRYHYESEFELGVKSVIDCYKNAYKEHKQEMWNVVISTYSIIAEDDNKMWSVRHNKVDLHNNDMYEKMIQIFQRIGDILEISVKHIVQEIYALVYLQDKGCVDYEKIKKQDFGVVINNIITKGTLQPVLVTEPSGMKLSDWRNIAYHHTYSIDSTGSIKCTYGKENRNIIVLSMQELENYAHKIIRSANALYIGRCIFLFDYIDNMPQNSAVETVSFRQNLCCEQFKIGLLSQEFMLGNVELSGEKVEIDIHDLSLDEEVKGRILHCAQLLLNTWYTWKRKEVSINYFAKNGERVCCVSNRLTHERHTVDSIIRETYHYDNCNRLKELNRRTYEPDGVTPRLDGQAQSVPNYPDAEVRYVGKTDCYSYDRSGNLLSDGNATYTYDGFGRTAEVRMSNGNTQKNHYDAEGLRAEMEENGQFVKFLFAD